MIASRHFKYEYKCEIPPKDIFLKMTKANIDEIYNFNEEPQKIDYNIQRNKIYFSRRKELKNLITSINTYINYSSQSLFLTLYYMDLIFTNEDLEKVFYSHFNKNEIIPSYDIQMKNYALLSVACLMISYKYNENNPQMPTLSSFAKLLFYFSKKTFSFTLNEISTAEVVVVKLLKYKLNYFTIYHFFVFFFTHGFLLRKTLLRSNLCSKFQEKKILEKIYIQAREILDWIIESEEYYNYYFGKDNHLIAVEVLLWTTEFILNIKISDEENIFKLIFGVNISEIRHRQIVEIIEKLYSIKKGDMRIVNKTTFINKNSSKKLITTHNPSSYSTTIPSNISIYNINSIKSNYPTITSSYNYLSTFPMQINTNYDSFNTYYLYNGLTGNELNEFKSKMPYQNTMPNQEPVIRKEKTSYNHSVVNYPKNSLNRKLINSNQNTTSNFDINSLRISLNNNLAQTESSTRDNTYIKKIEKEPSDNKRNKKNKISINVDTEDIKGKKIYIKDSLMSITKKSLSCSKKDINTSNNRNNGQIIDISILSNNEDELKLEEKINRPKVFDNKNKLNINNNILISPPKIVRRNSGSKNEKQTLYKQYKESYKEINQKSINKNKSIKNTSKNNIVLTEELNKKTKNLYSQNKLSQTLESEPRDNNKKSIKIIKNNNSVNINTNNLSNNISNNNTNRNLINKKFYNQINKHNTIIINNNIQINTYFDNNNYNSSIDTNTNNTCNTNNTNTTNISNNIKTNSLYTYNNLSNNPNNNNLYNPEEFITLPNLSNKYKNIKNKQKLIYKSKNNANFINKSSNSLMVGMNEINGYNFNSLY